jgi:hypothetical protein
MALDEAAFRGRHPEFKGASSGLVQVKLADALKRLSPGLFGDSFDEAHGWLTAHLLATTPWGMAARLDPKAALMSGAKPGSTIYSLELRRLSLEAGAGIGAT